MAPVLLPAAAGTPPHVAQLPIATTASARCANGSTPRGDGDRLIALHAHPQGRDKHLMELEALDTEEQRHRRLCELNVIEQVAHVCPTTVVRDAWRRGQALAVHGWI